MGNDMTWEQKCRISALRAACASPYDPVFNAEELMQPDYERIDKQYIARILTRAEMFRNALLHNGRLDDVDSFIERA